MNRFFILKSRIFFLMLLSIAIMTRAGAQNFDYIYLHGEYKIKGHLLEVTPKKVRYKDENGNPSVKEGEDVLMVFNKAGDFIIFPQKELSALRTEEFLKATHFPKADFIVTLEKKMIAARIITRNEHEVIYEDMAMPGNERALSADLIALIIYKKGNHELFVSPSQSCAALTGVATLIRMYNGTAYTGGEIPVTSPAEIKTETAPSTATLQSEQKPPAAIQPEKEEATSQTGTEKENSEKTLKPETGKKGKDSQSKNSKAEGENNKKSPLAKKATREEAGSNSDSKTMTVKMDSAGFLTQEGLKIFNKKALEKTQELSALLTKITEKTTSPELAMQAVDEACNLFVNDDARVEVSTGNETDYKVRYKIRDFLNKLNTMKDAQVSIAWTNVNFVNNLQKGVDGTYSGTISFKEKLSGLSAPTPLYSDQHRVNTEVLLKHYRESADGSGNNAWEVVLSDIGLVVVK